MHGKPPYKSPDNDCRIKLPIFLLNKDIIELVAITKNKSSF